MKYTCLFGGGAIRGVAYVGVQKALEELGVQTQTYGGSSVGSIVATLLAVGYNAKEMSDIFMKVNFDLFKDVQFGIGVKPALSKGNVFLEWVRELIERKYYGVKFKKGKNKPVTFADLEKNLVIITTNLSDYSCKEFSRFETPDFEVAKAVRISCTMPGLMRPVEFDDAILVDGDLQKSWPMWKLSKNLITQEERVLEFRLEGYTKEHELNALNFANTIYSCMTACATSFVTEIYAQNDKFDYVVLDTGSIIIVDFNMPAAKRKALMQLGYDHTIEYFNGKLPHKKTGILRNYKLINSYLDKIKRHLDFNDVTRAKHRLNELFAELCEAGRAIDFDDFRRMKEFRAEFLANIKYPALFGKIKLKNADEVKAKLDGIQTKTSEKISEVLGYLSDFPAR